MTVSALTGNPGNCGEHPIEKDNSHTCLSTTVSYLFFTQYFFTLLTYEWFLNIRPIDSPEHQPSTLLDFVPNQRPHTPIFPAALKTSHLWQAVHPRKFSVLHQSIKGPNFGAAPKHRHYFMPCHNLPIQIQHVPFPQ